MIIIVKEVGTSSYALRSVPGVGGAFLAEEVPRAASLRCRAESRRDRVELQSRDAGAAAARLGIQADRLRNRARERPTPASIIVDAPFCVWQGAGPGQQMLRQLRPALCGAEDDALGRRAIAQPDDRPRRFADGMQKVIATAKKLGVGEYPAICRSHWAPATRPC